MAFTALETLSAESQGLSFFRAAARRLGKDGLLEAGAGGFESFRGEVGVAEVLEQFDGGVLREVEFVPVASNGSHAGIPAETVRT